MIQLTETAAAVVQKIIAEENNPNLALRVGVKGGGCSGFEYQLAFDTKQEEWDESFESNGIRILVDVKSLIYLTGTTIDYLNALTGGGFKFNNPNASGTCGCGTSFSI